MGELGPVLRAFAPGVVFVAVGPFGDALVFDVEEDEVDADGGGHGGHDASDFHESADAASAVVGAHDGGVVVGGVGVVVGPGAGVPVGGEEDAVFEGGVDGGDDVFALHGLACPEGGGEFLDEGGVAPMAHGGAEMFGAAGVGGCAWDAVAKLELLGDVEECGVGVEGGDGDCGVVFGGCAGLLGVGVVASGEEQEAQCGEDEGLFFHVGEGC